MKGNHHVIEGKGKSAEPAMGQRMFGALLRGVSTRQYGDILPQMAKTVGISKSAVSERAIGGERRTAERVAEPALG